jgi:hypothetical protein
VFVPGKFFYVIPIFGGKEEASQSGSPLLKVLACENIRLASKTMYAKTSLLFCHISIFEKKVYSFEQKAQKHFKRHKTFF